MSSRGKKIDVWEIYHENRHIPVEVRMFRGDPLKFEATVQEFDYEKVGYDLNKLREQVIEDVKKFPIYNYDQKLVIELEDNDGGYSHPDHVKDGTRLDEIEPKSKDLHFGVFREKISLEIHRMLIAETGETNYRHEKQLVRKYGQKDDASHYWRQHGRDREGTLWAELDDTPENRAALQIIMDGLRRLREQIRTLMEPDTLEVTLQAIHSAGNVKFLGDGKPEKPVKAQRKRRK